MKDGWGFLRAWAWRVLLLLTCVSVVGGMGFALMGVFWVFNHTAQGLEWLDAHFAPNVKVGAMAGVLVLLVCGLAALDLENTEEREEEEWS